VSLQSERIQLLMQRLSLTEMPHGYEALAEQAAQKNLPYCDFLEQMLECEAKVRQERNIKVRTQLEGFPDLKRLEQFDFKFRSFIDDKIRELASLRFLERRENAVFLTRCPHWRISFSNARKSKTGSVLGIPLISAQY
jgi:DNA replication protein DnaC